LERSLHDHPGCQRALRVIAELIAKGDRRWARFKYVET